MRVNDARGNDCYVWTRNVHDISHDISHEFKLLMNVRVVLLPGALES